jgi:hypothetical protein
MLDHRKYERRDASSCGGQHPRSVALDPEQEVGRDQHRLQREREAVLEAAAVLAPILGQPHERRDLRLARRPPEGAARETSQDRLLATAVVTAVRVAARVELRAALGRGAFGHAVGTTDLDRVHAHGVRGHALLLALFERLLRLREPLGRRVRRRLELQRLHDAGRRVRSRVVGRQAFVEPLDGAGDPVLARRDAGFEIPHHAREVVAVVGERRQRLRVERLRLDALAVDVQSDGDRRRSRGTLPPRITRTRYSPSAGKRLWT